ncbi:hypothetical protein DL96DRAFT_1614706 [Flagelloscypha sp. PMI_526]|nr:hypothetical protein DL96DRAFT_1614706 [Flagelloscypha sp. PMI_526]
MVSLSPLTAESALHLGPNACWLLQLPKELCVRILQACTIPSILTIRQCCTITCQYTKDRSVWIHQLLSFLAEMKIDLCGVAPDIDSLSSSDIELLVSRHLRARSQAWRYRNSSLPCVKWRVSGSEGIHSVRMIRGGRFLLGCSRDTLFLWDIGFQIGRPAEGETLICSTPISPPAGRTFDSKIIWRQHSVESILYVAIWTHKTEGHGPYMNIYKMDLSARKKEFQPVSQLLVPEGFSPGCIHTEKLTIFGCSPPTLGVHYYDPSITITWDFEPSASGGATILHLSIPDSMSKFALIHAEETGTSPTQHLTDFKPFRTWDMSNGFPGYVNSEVSWDEGLRDAIYFDQFRADEETLTILRTSVAPKHPEFNDRPEPEFLAGPTIHLPRSTLGEFHKNMEIQLCTFADGTRVLYWSADESVDGGNLVMHFSDANDEFLPFHVIVGNQKPVFHQVFEHSVAVSIGRICILDEGKVEIWELC